MPSGTRECDLRATKDGPSRSYTISCRTHNTVSLQRFRGAVVGYQTYVCDPAAMRFIVDDSVPGNSTPAVMVDLTGLRDLLRTYPDPAVNPDREPWPNVYRWLAGGYVEKVGFVCRTITAFDLQDYSRENWAAVDASGAVYTEYTVRIDGRV